MPDDLRSPLAEILDDQAAADLARPLKALGNPTRLQMFSIIANEPGVIAARLAERLVLDVGAIQRHLQILRDAGLVEKTLADGRSVAYWPIRRAVQQLGAALSGGAR